MPWTKPKRKRDSERRNTRVFGHFFPDSLTTTIVKLNYVTKTPTPSRTDLRPLRVQWDLRLDVPSLFFGPGE